MTAAASKKQNKTKQKHVITCTAAAEEHLFVLTPKMRNQSSNFSQSVIQHDWLPEQNKTKITG